jgi:hypothetical protein
VSLGTDVSRARPTLPPQSWSCYSVRRSGSRVHRARAELREGEGTGRRFRRDEVPRRFAIDRARGGLGCLRGPRDGVGGPASGMTPSSRGTATSVEPTPTTSPSANGARVPSATRSRAMGWSATACASSAMGAPNRSVSKRAKRAGARTAGQSSVGVEARCPWQTLSESRRCCSWRTGARSPAISTRPVSARLPPLRGAGFPSVGAAAAEELGSSRAPTRCRLRARLRP